MGGHYLCTNGKGSQVGNNGKCVANCALLTSSDWGSNGAAGTCTLANGVAGGKCTSGCVTGYSLKAGTGTFSCPATGTKWAVKVAPKCVADCPALVTGALAAGKFGVKGAVGKCTKEKAQPLLDGKTKACTQACAGGYALKTGTGPYPCAPATGTNWKADSGKAAVCLKTCALPTKTTGSANGGWGGANVPLLLLRSARVKLNATVLEEELLVMSEPRVENSPALRNQMAPPTLRRGMLYLYAQRHAST